MSTALRPAPVLRAAVPEDRYALGQMLTELSPLASFERFFSGGFRVTDKSLDVLMCANGTGRAFVAVDRHRVVAHAMWATPRHDDRRAEIAFVVAADHRGQGLGERLTRLALADAAGRGIAQAEATVLATNHAAQTVVRRLLPHATSTNADGEITFLASLAGSYAVGPKFCRPTLKGRAQPYGIPLPRPTIERRIDISS